MDCAEEEVKILRTLTELRVWGEIAHLTIWAKLHCRLLAPYHKGTRRVSNAPARAQPYATYVQIGTMTVQQKLIANDNTFILAGKGGKG